jgi:hypothetical protein
MLKYYLVENPLSKDESNYVAHVSSPETKTLDHILNKIIAEGTGLTRPQALAYFEKITQTVLEFLKDGHCVSTPFFRVRPTISGLFVDEFDSFDATRHKINAKFLPGEKLSKLNAEFYMEKCDIQAYQPRLKKFTDAATTGVDTIATPGGIGTINGKHLFFDKNNLELGVFFVPVNNPGTAIRAMIYSRIFPKELSFCIPVLEPGDYRILVKTQPKKDILSSLLVDEITV